MLRRVGLWAAGQYRLVDEEGDVYYSVANGYYSPNAPERLQNERLYTNSLVKLDVERGWVCRRSPPDILVAP